MSDVKRFVEQRLAENTLPPAIDRTYRTIHALADKIRDDGETDDWVDWLLDAEPIVKIGEYIFGADPATDAERVSDCLYAALARTWQDHPDFDPVWNELVPDPGR